METCIIIPVYNHGKTIEELLGELAHYHLPCVIVDDGSDAETKQHLQQAEKQFPFVSLITLPINQGKGAAVLTGLRFALENNYTHAIQIDADGQHDAKDIPKFLEAGQENLDAIIAGQPIFDYSVPKNRLYGRAIANFWAHIETLSFQIKDAMCGFRLYPLNKLDRLMNNISFGKAMDFDIEILVRSMWEGIAIIFIPTQVIYPLDGISNFRPWKDNLKIFWLNTRLFFGMLIRLPKLMMRHFQKNRCYENEKHWSQTKEMGNLWGLKFTLLCYKLLGRKVTVLLLYPIIGYFYLTQQKKREASKQYLSKLEHYLARRGKKINFNKNASFIHFMSFGQMLLDKLSVWNNDISLEQIEFPDKQLFLEQAAEKRGGVIFTAHLGNIEIARSLSRFEPELKINAIVFNDHARKFNSVLEQINPAVKINLIEVKKIDITLAIELKEKVSGGEFIVIVCDRVSSVGEERCVKASFLDQDAYFPQGSFILAGLMQCPTYFMLCLKHKKNHFKIVFEEFAKIINLPKTNRNIPLQQYAQHYAQLLEQYCEEYPLQWFNFFDFWKIVEERAA